MSVIWDEPDHGRSVSRRRPHHVRARRQALRAGRRSARQRERAGPVDRRREDPADELRRHGARRQPARRPHLHARHAQRLRLHVRPHHAPAVGDGERPGVQRRDQPVQQRRERRVGPERELQRRLAGATRTTAARRRGSSRSAGTRRRSRRPASVFCPKAGCGLPGRAGHAVLRVVERPQDPRGAVHRQPAERPGRVAEGRAHPRGRHPVDGAEPGEPPPVLQRPERHLRAGRRRKYNPAHAGLRVVPGRGGRHAPGQAVARGPRRPAHRAGQARDAEPGRERQGPHRHPDDRGRRAVGRAEARAARSSSRRRATPGTGWPSPPPSGATGASS